MSGIGHGMNAGLRLLFWVVPVLLIHGGCDDASTASIDPWDRVPRHPEPTNHSRLFEGQNLADGPSVTKACLECHPHSAAEIMQTSHWLWLGEPEKLPGRDKPLRIGKRNLINNFCISIEGNWPTCTRCHAGYGWEDEGFDFTDEHAVDCLICHDRSGQYSKGLAGNVAEGVDLLAAARSVGRPRRDNCGWCHFNGGGGNAVKHGDLDGSLVKPVERVDVHMGRHDFLCTDCHQTEKHDIPGRMISVAATDTIEMQCTDCHAPQPHGQQRLDEHTSALACQACHLPEVARTQPTKIAWDWSTAGRQVKVNDPHRYLKKKGSFLYAEKLVPEYYWFSGEVRRYLKGDPVNRDGVTHINYPLGEISDPESKIWPFKVHRAKQPYDIEHGYLIIPKTYGDGGYWSDFDWMKAAELGGKAAGLPFGGQIGFTETDMYWTLTHMIAPRERALQCTDCHAEKGRLDWRSLGYGGDPAFVGGRRHLRLVDVTRENPP